MTENLMDALQVTVVGMALIFGLILLLWAMMALLVRWGRDTEQASLDETPSIENTASKQQAAAIAVAIAMALDKQEAKITPRFPLPQTATVSAWQAVMRSNTLKERGIKR